MIENWRGRLHKLVNDSGLSPEKLCAGIEGVSPYYLRGLLKRPKKSNSPNLDRLGKVAAKNGWSLTWIMTGDGPAEVPQGVAEAGAVFIAEPKMTNVDTRAALVLYPHAHCEVWEVRDNAVLLLGYAPGDRILVDPKAVPMLGDVVIATIADRQIGLGETMLRLYRPPFLVPASIDPRLQPCALADGAVTIKGVVVAQYRLTAHTRPTENYQAA